MEDHAQHLPVVSQFFTRMSLRRKYTVESGSQGSKRHFSRSRILTEVVGGSAGCK